MSSMLRNRTGQHAHHFAREHLFSVLNIETFFWETNSEDHPHTGGGLHLRPRDIAKFGALYLNGGRWGDHQVLPREWVRQSTQRHVTFSDKAPDPFAGYGYLWWIFNPDTEGGGTQDIIAATGLYGQYIFLVPEHNMVVVFTALSREYEDQYRPMMLLYSDILPAVERRFSND